MTTSRAFIVLAPVAAALAGCGGGISVPRTAPVAGTVLLKGRPVAGVLVTFHPRFDIGAVKFTPNGLTDASGRFTLSTAAPGDGAPPGEYAVTFELMRATADKAGRDDEVDVWKGKYADPAVSTKIVTVGKGENKLDPFNLD